MISLHIDTGREMRGGQWQVLYLLRGLVERGEKALLLSPAGSDLLQAALAQRLDARPLGMASLAGGARGVNLIHAHDARAHNLGLLIKKPLIVSRRVAFAIKRGPLSRWKYRRADHFIAVSQFIRRILVDAGIEDERITVVHDGVPIPPSQADPGERVLALDSDDPGKCKTILEKTAELAGVPITFSKNLSRDLAGAGVFVYITQSEGLGSAALLAMARGVPVVASAVGGLPEIVENGCTGLLTSNDPIEIASQVHRLMGDRALAHRLATQARNRVEQEFSVEQMVRETMRVYERILV